MNKIIEELETIQKLIDAEECEKASKEIDKLKKEILTKQDASQYIDDLVGNLK